MKGNMKQNEKYCSKETTLHHFGKQPIQNGARADRNDVYDMLEQGAGPIEIMKHDFTRFCRFRNGIYDFYSFNKPTRPEEKKTEVYLFFGQPGCGKTELAKKQHPDYYRLPLGKNFWLTPSAQGKKHIIIDDFKSNVSLADLLQMLDNDPVEVEKKGAFIWWFPDTIIITTNKSPHNWYNYNSRDYEKEALFRRFENGGCYRFYKNAERVPTPIEIDINNPIHFEAEFDPRKPLRTHINLLMNTREDGKWCIIHGEKKCECMPGYLCINAIEVEIEEEFQYTKKSKIY